MAKALIRQALWGSKPAVFTDKDIKHLVEVIEYAQQTLEALQENKLAPISREVDNVATVCWEVARKYRAKLRR